MTIKNPRNLLKNIQNLHTNIAADVWPDGCRLHCERCGKREMITAEQAAEYLAHGWPTCCGLTMSMKTAVSEEAEP